MAAGAGIVVRARGRRSFIPAAFVQRVTMVPRLSAVPGSSIRMALFEGKVIPVVELGSDGPHLVVCSSDGETIGLAGVDVERTGELSPAGSGVRIGDDEIPALDLAAEIALASARPPAAPTGPGEPRWPAEKAASSEH